MSYSIIISHMGPSPTGSMLVILTATEDVFKAGDTVSVSHYSDVVTYRYVGKSFSTGTIPDLEIVSGIGPWPVIELRIEKAPQVKPTNAIKIPLQPPRYTSGSLSFKNLAPEFHHVVHISICDANRRKMKELPVEIWTDIISMGLDMESDRVIAVARLGAVNNHIRSLARESFLRKTICSDSYRIVDNPLCSKEVGFAIIFCQHFPYPVQSLEINKESKVLLLRGVEALTPHMHTLVSLGLSITFCELELSSDLVLPSLKRLYARNLVSFRFDEYEAMSLELIEGLVSRCPSLSELSLTNFFFPRPYRRYTFPRLERLWLQDCTNESYDEDDIPDAGTFMNMCSPHTLQIETLQIAPDLLCIPNEPETRIYPTVLVLERAQRADITCRQLFGIEKVVIHCKPGIAKLAIEVTGRGLGDLELVASVDDKDVSPRQRDLDYEYAETPDEEEAQLDGDDGMDDEDEDEDEEELIKAWNEMTIDRSKTWKTVLYKKI